MTNREFYEAIANGNFNDELTAFATEAIAKLDATNAKRKAKPSKTATENAPIIEAIAGLLNDTPQLAADIASQLDISVQKASALLRAMVTNGTAASIDVTVPKKGKQKAYTVAG